MLRKLSLTWISEIEVVLNVTGDVVFFPVLYPVSIRLFIIADEDPKQDDHCYLPHEAHSWKADADVGVFWTVTQVPEALNAAHGFFCCRGFIFLLFKMLVEEVRLRLVRRGCNPGSSGSAK